MSTRPPPTLAAGTCIVRDTAGAQGPHAWRCRRGRAARAICTTAGSILDAGDDAVAFATGDFETGLVCLRGRRRGRRRRPTLHARSLRRDLRAARRPVQVRAGADGCDLAEIAAPVTAAHPVQVVRFAESARTRPALRRRRPDRQARPQRAHRQERPGRPHHGRRHLQPAGQLDVVAAARARRDARRGLPLHRHAGAGVRHPAGLHRRA